MIRIILYIIATFWGVTALYLWFWPNHFYNNVPGVSAMGPFNLHFIRDVALVYLMSSGALFWGVSRNVPPVVVTGVAWSSMHALFHIYLWVTMNIPTSVILSDFGALVVPSGIALYCALQLKGDGS